MKNQAISSNAFSLPNISHPKVLHWWPCARIQLVLHACMKCWLLLYPTFVLLLLRVLDSLHTAFLILPYSWLVFLQCSRVSANQCNLNHINMAGSSLKCLETTELCTVRYTNIAPLMGRRSWETIVTNGITQNLCSWYFTILSVIGRR